jgi:hypothetical protein
MSSAVKKLLLVIVPSLVLLAFFGAGLATGTWRRSASGFGQEANAFVAGGMLVGRLADAERKDRLAQAYHDPVRARREMDDYGWAGFQVLTPFVGNLQAPGRWGSAEINEVQLRSAHPLVLPKPEGVCRIFVTGGSTAFGSGAPSNETTVAGYLQALLNERLPLKGVESFEVTTAASPAWASTHERIFIENRLSEFDPDLVVSFSGNNDVHAGERAQNVLWYRSNADAHYWDLLSRIYAETDYGPVAEFVPEEPGPVDAALVSARLVKNVRLSAYALRLVGAAYLFALQPNLFVTAKPFAPVEKKYAERYDFDDTERPWDNVIEYHRRTYARVREELSRVDEPNFGFVDLSGVFDELDANTVVFLDKFHFGDRGNEQIARALYPHVVRALSNEAR